jgi:hypothetical protein
MATLSIITAYTFLWYLLGRMLKTRLWPATRLPYSPYFYIGASWIVGAIIFLTTWTLFAHCLGNARVGLMLATALTLCLTAYFYDRSWYRDFASYRWLVVLLIIVGSIILMTAKALVPMPAYFGTYPELVHPMGGFGAVGHSFRAGNLVYYIVSENELPRINQHSGQAIMASIPLFLGSISAQFSLVVVLAFFIALLGLTTYGLARTCINRPLLALIPVGTVFLGNTVLSPFYSSIVDTDSALLLSSNSESLFGVMSFVVTALMLYERYQARAIATIHLLLLTAAAFIWNITSGQMILLLLLIVGFWIIYNWWHNGRQRLLVLSCICIAFGGAVGSIVLGGMLSFTTTPVALPGLMELRNPEHPPLALRFPRTSEGNPKTLEKLRLLQERIINPDKAVFATTPPAPPTKESFTTKVKSRDWLFALAKLVRSVQLIFIPLCALSITAILLHRYRHHPFHTTHMILYISALLFFTIGWLISTTLAVYGYYWELSKFFFVGVFASMFLTGLLLALAIAHSTQRLVTISVMIMCAVIMCGPATELLVVRIIGNTYFSPTIDQLAASTLPIEELRPLSLHERFDLLMSAQKIYGTAN